MSDLSAAPNARALDLRPLQLGDIARALSKGWADFRAAPGLGFVFGAVYVAFGLIVVGLTIATGQTFYAVPITLGFPLVAPFAAVGLYEISRRLEQGLALNPAAVFGRVGAERHRQCPWFGAIMVIWFLFYLFFSHVLFALVMGPSALTNISSSFEIFLSPRGMLLIAAQIAVGGLFALTIFATCVIGLPLMMEREIDFVTATVASIRAVLLSPIPMLAWAFTVAALVIVAMIPAFLGLFIVLPVLGHATWHVYRAVLPAP